MRRIRHAAMVALALALGACVAGLWTRGEPRRSPLGPLEPLRRVAAPELRARGISGVAHDDRGRLWAVSEEQHELVRFASASAVGPIERFPIDGIAEGLELESAAWLGADTLAIGTETDGERDEDAVLIVRIEGRRARVASTTHLSWRSELGVAAPHNAGIEGLCAAGGRVLAAGEMVVGVPRTAPLALAPHHGADLGPWRLFALRLTSATGKISALDCVEDEHGSLDVHAVERHYGVTRLLRFTVAPVPDAEIVPELVADVSAIAPDLPNVEGLVVEAGRFVLLSDHDDPGDDGTTEILTLSRGGRGRGAPPTGGASRSTARLSR